MASLPQHKAVIGWAFQSAKGTPATSAKHRVWLTGGSRVAAAVVKADFIETSGYATPQDAYIESSEGKGAPEFFCMPDSIAAALYGVLGTKAVSGVSDPYQHTLTEAPDLPYVTVFMSTSGALFEVYADCKIVGLKIHGESGKPLLGTMTVAGGIAAYSTTEDTTQALEHTNRFLYYDGKAALKLEGAAVPLMRSFDLDIQRQPIVIPGDWITPADLALGTLAVSLAISTTPADFGEYNRVVYGSAAPSAAAPPTTAPDSLTGSPAVDLLFTRVAASRTLELSLPVLQRDPFVDAVSATPGPLVRTQTLKAYKPQDGSSILTAVVKSATPVIL